MDLSNAINWLGQLVALDTQNGMGDEVAAVQFLAEKLAAHSPDQLIVENVARNRGKTDSAYVLAVWGRPQILLNVHIDTVPAGEGWSGSPFVLREAGERLIGLGTSDIKGAAACILAVLDESRPVNAAILFSGDEELGSEVMPEVIKRGHYANAPMAIVCEPTDGLVGRRHRGILAFTARAKGPGGHSSLADHVDAPLAAMTRFAARLADYGVEHVGFGEPPYQGLCLNIGNMRADGAYNVIPTSAQLWFSMRPPPGDDLAVREAEIARLSEGFTPEIELERLVALKPFRSKGIEAFEPIFQGGYNPGDLQFWTEAAMLSEAGVNAVVYGPGEVGQAHRPDESVTKASLKAAMTVYQCALSGSWSAESRRPAS